MPYCENVVAGDMGEICSRRSMVVGGGRDNPGMYRTRDLLAVFLYCCRQSQVNGIAESSPIVRELGRCWNAILEHGEEWLSHHLIA